MMIAWVYYAIEMVLGYGDEIKPTFEEIAESTNIFSSGMRLGSERVLRKIDKQQNLLKTILTVYVLVLVLFLFRTLVLLCSICGQSKCSVFFPCCSNRPAEEIKSKLDQVHNQNPSLKDQRLDHEEQREEQIGIQDMIHCLAKNIQI